MVTTEAAIALGSVVAVLAMAVGGLAALLTQVAAVDAAREAARVAAVSGVDEGADAGVASLGAKPGEVTVDYDGTSMIASVRVDAPGLPNWAGIELSAEAVSRAEMGVGG